MSVRCNNMLPTITSSLFTLGMCGWQKMTLVQFYKINCGFSFFWFDFTFVCRRHLSFTPLRYGARNVPVCWIGTNNYQPKWLRTRSAEIRHEEKHLRLLTLSCWKMNCEWDNVKNRPPNRWSRFFNRMQKLEFSVFEFWGQFGSVFRKPINNIFIRFHTPLVYPVLPYHSCNFGTVHA